MLPIIGALAPIVGKVIDKVFPDTEKRDMAKLEIMAELQKQSGDIEKAAAQIINTEAASKHWLAANWRPLTMLFFVGLIGARWFGFVPDSPEQSVLVITMGGATSAMSAGGPNARESVVRPLPFEPSLRRA